MRRLFLWAIDLALVAVSGVAAIELRNGYGLNWRLYENITPYLTASLLAWAIVSLFIGTSRSIWRFSSMSDYLRIVWAAMATTAIAAVLAFLLNRLDSVARSIPVLHFLVMVIALVGARVAMRLRHSKRQSRQPVQMLDGVTKTVLVLGVGPLSELYLRSLQEVGGGQTHVAGLIGRREDQVGRLIHNRPVLGTPDHLERILRDLTIHGVFVDEIVVAMPISSLLPDAKEALMNIEQTTAIQVRFVAEELGLESRTAPMKVSRAPSIIDADVERAARRSFWRFKRAFDLAAAACLIFILSPLFLAISILVAVDVGLPVAFWQTRPGLGGRPFKCHKFRTMRAAHDSHGRLVPDADRLTGTGRLLRRTRLDELPQLFNILVGDMSLVGPRPLLPIDQPEAYQARLLVRPGLTGWAQINTRRDASPADKGALDIWYIQNSSFSTDLRIIAMTIIIVLIGDRVDNHAVASAKRLSKANGELASNLEVSRKLRVVS